MRDCHPTASFFFFSFKFPCCLTRVETANSASPHCKLLISKGQSAVHPSPQDCLPQGAKAYHLLSQVRLPGCVAHTVMRPCRLFIISITRLLPSLTLNAFFQKHFQSPEPEGKPCLFPPQCSVRCLVCPENRVALTVLVAWVKVVWFSLLCKLAVFSHAREFLTFLISRSE